MILIKKIVLTRLICHKCLKGNIIILNNNNSQRSKIFLSYFSGTCTKRLCTLIHSPELLDVRKCNRIIMILERNKKLNKYHLHLMEAVITCVSLGLLFCQQIPMVTNGYRIKTVL